MASKIIYIAIAAIVVVALAALLTTQMKAPEQTVYIGALLPLTGGLQTYGIGARDAVALALEDASKTCPKYKFEMILEDSGTDPVKAQEKLQAMYARGVRLVVGPMSSREVSAVKSFADGNKIIIFSPSSTSPLLALPGDWIYRMVPTDDAQARALVDLVKTLGLTKIVILYRNDAWGLGLKDAIEREASAAGVQVVASEGYDPDPKVFPTAIPAAVKKLSGALKTPDAALVLVTFEDDGIVAIKAAAADPVLSKTRWIGTDGIAESKALASEVGKEMAAAKLLGTVASPDPNDPSFQKFRQEYVAKYNREPVAYDSYAYDAAMLLATIVCQLDTTDPEKVRTALEQWGREGKYTGVTGTVYLNENGDRAFPNYRIWGVVVEGERVKYINAGYYYGAERKLIKYPEGEALFK